MNPELNVVMKHGKMLFSGQVNVKKVGMHSGAKEGVLGIVDKGMDDGFDGEESMEAEDDVTEDGLVSEVGLEKKEVRDEVIKKDGVVKGVFSNEPVTNAGGDSRDLIRNLAWNGWRPWLVDQKPMFVQRWVACICLDKLEPARIPLWVKIYNVPLEACNVEGISRITSIIGTLIIKDKQTTSMCERGYGKASFARVLIEVDVVEGIVDNVEIWWQSTPSKRLLRMVLTLQAFNFSSKVQVVLAMVGERYILVKNMAKEKTSDMEGMNKQELDKEVRKDQATQVKHMAQKNFSLSNRFSTLVDEEQDDKLNELQGIKINIDVACDMGIPIGEEESVKWPHDLQEYYKTMCDIMEKKAKMELLHNRNKTLEGDISKSKSNFDVNVTMKAEENMVEEMKNSSSFRNQAFDFVYVEAYSKESNRIEKLVLKKQLAEVELFIFSKKPFDDKVKEGCTNEMLEFYEANADLNVHNMNEKNKKMTSNDAMDDEVSEDLSAHANFMTQNVVSSVVDTSIADMVNNDDAVETRLNKKLVSKACNNVFGKWTWVSNVMDASRNCRIIIGWDSDMVDAALLSSYDQVMHFEVSLILDKRKFFISFVYDENEPKDRIGLWENFIDHMGIIDSKPWVMMGDFNAILYSEDHSKGFANVYQGIREFRSCVQQLDMEYLARNGLFYTWVQRSKDPENGIMKKLNRVMGNSDFLDIFWASKKFHRVVKNSWNVPVYGFAMFIFAKRLKNMKRHIRELNKSNEADMVLNSAYRDDMMDEEKVLKDVSNKEIKATLFDIDDNKALGPDGFTSSGKMLGELDNTLISLVPKCNNPVKVADYRPIACCNVVYKCISKVISNRIKVVLNGIIDSNQNAFIEGRQISDNIMLDQELMFGYLGKMKGARCAFKIMVCISLASFSICVNGESRGFFKAKRGLRQGDHVSPYLFTIIMKVFTLMLKRQVCNEAKFKCHWGFLRRALDEFCLSFGLRPNMAKSIIYFGNVHENVKRDIMIAIPFREGSFPIRYLGRLQLIASVLSSLNVFWAIMFILPQGVCDEIDKIFKEFLWKSNGKRKIRYSVAWKDVCLQKSEGGLGLKSIHVWNEDLMAKHLWNVVINKDLIWVKRDTRFKEVLDIHVPTLSENNDEKVVWIYKKGKEKNFNVNEVCKGLKENPPKERNMRFFGDVGRSDEDWSSLDRWLVKTIKRLAFKYPGPWKTKWSWRDLVSMLLDQLVCSNLVDCSSSFLSMGMNGRNMKCPLN
nr:hypothetical protein [Tanacetum cinerariifolium]GEV08250.1 hypothetical protein [Tanacetum cinerariifolium]